MAKLSDHIRSIIYYTVPRTVFNRMILKHISRTFAVTIPEIEQGMRQATTIGYNLARILDSFEDEGSIERFSAKERITLIDEFLLLIKGQPIDSGHSQSIYESILRFSKTAGISNSHYRLLLRNAHRVVKAKEGLNPEVQAVIAYWLEEMGNGMKKYLRHKVKGFKNLDEYCYYVAGTVGGMMTELMYHFSGNLPRPDKADPLLLQHAFSLGKFLQMVNIIRDFRHDALRQKDYWPSSLFSDIDTKTGSLQQYQERSRKALAKMIVFTEQYRKAAFDYIMSIPKDLPGYRKFCLLNFIMVNKTLEMVKQQQSELFTSDEKVRFSRRFLFRILAADILTLQRLASAYVIPMEP